MNLDAALSYIHSVAWQGSKPGLSRTRELLRQMGDPQKKLRFVHVAGTNGKGSTCAMLESILRHAGYRTGLYTSPYISRFHERMQVDGDPISDEMLCTVTEFVQPFADAMQDSPTEFELVTAIAMEFFARSNCDIVLLECGMGGELDSTNVIDTPECAVMCTVGLDHTEFLGSTLPAIARTKAGIFKQGGLCVTYPADTEVEAVYREAAQQRQLNWRRADFSRLHPMGHDLRGQSFTFDGFGALQLSLLGKNQLENAAMVLTVVEALREKGWKIPDSAVSTGLSRVRWPGRFELLQRSPDVIADGGHNPQCMNALCENIRAYLPGRRIIAVVGVLADKEYEEMFRPILPYVEKFITVTPPNPRALHAIDLAETLVRLGAEAVAAECVKDGLELALLMIGKEDAVLVFGSLYMLGDVRRCILGE